MDGLQNFLDHSGGLCQTKQDMVNSQVLNNGTESAELSSMMNATTIIGEDNSEYDCVEVKI